MKLRFLLLILVLLLTLICGGGAIKEESVPERTLTVAEKIPGKLYLKIILPPEPEEPPLPEFQAQMDEDWLPLLENRKLTAKSYFVYDLDLDQYLILSGQESDRVYPASITKLFTAYVALRYIPLDQQITVGSEIWMADADSSKAGLRYGDRITAEQLVAAMLLPSGNDAAYSLAVNVGDRLGCAKVSDREAVKRFMRMMNTQAKLLGMNDTNFVTPDGFHADGHYTCIADIITIAKLALADPVISSVVAQPRMRLALGNRTLEIKNSNLLLNEDSKYYCSYAVGLKTGYTSKAGNCLLTVCRQGERELLIGVFGCRRYYDRFPETLLLFAQATGLETPGVEPVAGTVTADAQ